ncbi:MAG TPA: phosphotransferase [Chloroflexia bacterium]
MNHVAENGTANRNRKLEQHRELATAALEQYCLAGAELTLLSDADNTVFRVDVPGAESFNRHPYLGKVGGRRFVLRVSNGQHAEATRSELIWLAALLRDTDLTVPEPVPTRDGALLASSNVPHAESASVVLLRWVDGQSLDAGLDPEMMVKVGRYMAELHAHSESFTPPAGFQRPRWDRNRLFGAGSVLRAPNAGRYFSRGELKLFEAAAERVGRTMQRLGEGHEVFGLIHADLHNRSYLFQGDRVGAIDFSDCGWGYYLYDIAIALGELKHRDDYPALHAAFLAGYRQVRPLSEQHEGLINTFMVARRVDLVNNILSWEDPFLLPWVPRFLEKSIEVLKKYLGN